MVVKGTLLSIGDPNFDFYVSAVLVCVPASASTHDPYEQKYIIKPNFKYNGNVYPDKDTMMTCKKVLTYPEHTNEVLQQRMLPFRNHFLQRRTKEI